jgi:hypothetical protein
VLIINTIAKKEDISKYINLITAIKLVKLIRLVISIFLTIKLEAILLANLD